MTDDPNRDFLVLRRDGSVRAGPLYVEDATMVMRLLPDADRVVRQSDGVLIACKRKALVANAEPRSTFRGRYSFGSLGPRGQA